MACPLAPDWLTGRGKGIGKLSVQSSTATSCLQNHCPAHESSTYSATNGELNESSCLSGCCCLRKHNKTTDIFKELSERNLCIEDECPPSDKNESGSWCQRRVAYYQQRFLLSEATSELILKRMRKEDLEILLSALVENQSLDSEVSAIIIRMTFDTFKIL